MEVRPHPVSRLLIILNQYSLDASLVALTWLWTFEIEAQTRLSWGHYLLLGGSVWCVYTADRLLDGLAQPTGGPVALRHVFAEKHFAPLLAACIAVTSLMIVLSLALLPWAVLLSWIAVASILGLYLVLVHWIRPARMAFPKELLVAFIFAAGSSIFVFATRPESWARLLVPFCAACLLFFGNTWAISKWELPLDRPFNRSSIALDFPRSSRFLPWYLVGLILAALVAPMFALASWRIGASVAASSALLLVLDRRGSHIGLQERRELADLVLLTPLVAGIPYLAF